MTIVTQTTLNVHCINIELMPTNRMYSINTCPIFKHLSVTGTSALLGFNHDDMIDFLTKPTLGDLMKTRNDK